MTALLAPARAREWWEHKFAPILGTAYATACFADASVMDVADTLLVVLLALLPGAVFVSVVNDLTDRDDDRRAGKPDRLAGHSARTWLAVVAAAVLAGFAIGAAAWHDEPAALVLYSMAWVAFALYSVPPFRLKARGAGGVLADAVGAHVCPHLLIAVVVFAAVDRPDDARWLVAVGAWALAWGVRGALWHQLSDAEQDARAGIRTYAIAHPRWARRLGAWFAFPVELAAFGVLLVLAEAPLAVLAVPAYVLLEAERVKRWGITVVVVEPAPNYRIAMHDFYVAFFPLAFLATAALRDPSDAIVLLAHLGAFPFTPGQIAADVVRRVRRLSLGGGGSL